MPKHPREIEDYSGNLEELAEDIGNLHYESLEEFMGHLKDKIENDAQSDKERGKEKLSEALYEARDGLEQAERGMKKAWEISEPFMDE